MGHGKSTRAFGFDSRSGQFGVTEQKNNKGWSRGEMGTDPNPKRQIRVLCVVKSLFGGENHMNQQSWVHVVNQVTGED